MRAFRLGLVLVGLLASCSAGSGEVRLVMPAPSAVRVNETRRVPIEVVNPAALELAYTLALPALPGIDRVLSVSGTPAGAEVRFTPLASHVGMVEATVIASAAGREVARTAVLFTVSPSLDAAPVFLRPGAGGTYDLTRDPCVRVELEVRDDDDADVEIRSRSPLPAGAVLDPDGVKRALFSWCPSSDQIDASERWTLSVEADDAQHAPTPLDYVIVLRGESKPNCPGDAPVVAFVAPSEGAEATAPIDVLLDASDDQGLREPPLLYFSTTMPETPPDVTQLEQVPFVADGSRFRARVPGLTLAPGERRALYLVAAATDNDDAQGTACDHRTETSVRTVTAIGAMPTAQTAACDACAESGECMSGICAASGRKCLEACGAGCARGTCGATTTTEGASVMACGDAVTACTTVTACVDDAMDGSAMAARAAPTMPLDGIICPQDQDWFRATPSAGEQVTAQLDFDAAAGDLDLQLVSGTGAVLASSAGRTGTERAQTCAPSPVFVKVYGFGAATNRYRLSVTRAAGVCCMADTAEPNDTRTAARAITGTAFDGRVCPRDDDWFSFTVAQASRATITVILDARAGDLDLELFSSAGALLGSSRTTTDTETITQELLPGTYALRVFGVAGATGDYVGEVALVASLPCTRTLDCPEGSVCAASTCRPAACAMPSDCPAMHACVTTTPSSTPRACATTCTTNTECRSSEGCKQLVEGRACLRRGTAANGASCRTHADCGGQRACLALTGGYCARAACTTNADCESGTFCAMTSVGRACVLACPTGDSVCRLAEGYVCRGVADATGMSRLACVRP